MRRYASLRLSFVLTVVLTVAHLLFSLAAVRPAYAQRPTDDEVRQMIARTDDNSFVVRTKNQAKLEGLLTTNRLTPAQVGMIQTAINDGPSLESRRRMEKALAAWSSSLEPVRQIIDATRFETTKLAGRDWEFNLDGFHGGANKGEPAVVQLEKLYQAARNASTAGDTTKMTDALKALRDFVNNDNNFNALYLHHGRDFTRKATKKEVVDELQKAVDNSQKAIKAIEEGMGNPNPAPPPRQMMPMNGNGAAANGLTFGVSLLSAPAVGGNIDVFMVPTDLALAPPPDGYEFVSEIFDIMAVDALSVTGNISVYLAYDGDLFSTALPSEQAQWQLVRIANGRVESWLSQTNDTTNFVLSGIYAPLSASSGQDQFGTFAIVGPAQAAAPEPAAALLMLTVCLFAGLRPFLLPDRDSSAVQLRAKR